MTQYLKAIYGAAVAFVGSLGTALVDGQVSSLEWATIGGATLAALGIIWGIPNTPPDASAGKHAVPVESLGD